MAKASAAASAMVENEGGRVTTPTTTTTQLTGVLLRMDHHRNVWHHAVYALTQPNAGKYI